MLERFETSAEKAFFLSLCATVVLGVAVAVASVHTQIGVASPGFVVWQNLIVPAIGAIGPSPEAAHLARRSPPIVLRTRVTMPRMVAGTEQVRCGWRRSSR